MTRKEFLIKIGIGAGVAILTPVAFNACEESETESDKDDDTDDNGDDSSDDSDKVDFNIDLTADDYSDLQEEGGYVYENDIIIAYLGNDEYIALSKICTHNQCTVDFDGDEEKIYCSCHGSEFNLEGEVTSGPADEALKEYNTELDGQTLRIYE
ncbi:MAG: Rieske (2Fe-2S) protein [Bacteroidales bacterium]|nr:Rieske (2Fe-2S) protein [Bacteroidales bacterium]MBS3776557.1 Rieske (2Fe-2S) protein [Bacteroidales bacterium]